jgi:hypothetical protein
MSGRFFFAHSRKLKVAQFEIGLSGFWFLLNVN